MRWVRWVGGFVVAVVAVAMLFVGFGLGTLRGPIERKVGELTGRELHIGALKPVWDWRHMRFRAEKVSFANPEWATEELMLRADAVEASVELLPLFIGQVYLPEVHLVRPELNLEISADDRKNWILDPDQKPKEGRPSRFHIKALTFDEARLKYDDAIREISVEAQLSTDATGVTAFAQGVYRGVGAAAAARGAPVLGLKDADTPYELHIAGEFGDTTVEADGSLTNIVQLTSVDLAIELSGKTLAGLYDVIGIALPETSAYRTSGRLVRTDHLVRYENFDAKVGESDLAGTLEFDTDDRRERPYMHGNVTAKTLNFADLGQLVGTDQPRKSGVLPDMPFDSDRWDSIDADVAIKAGTIKRPKQLPIENLATRIRMKDKVLTLDPLEFGIAGGKLAGKATLDGDQEPIHAKLDMRVEKLSLPKLFPTIEKGQNSIGDINGLIELSGRGDSVAQMLGTANGKLGVFIDGGQVSRFLMELAALDLWGVTKTKLKGDEPVKIRCAIGDFAVKDGVMNTNAFVFDTEVVNIQGSGHINLKNEGMDLTLKPEPKDRSVVSLNSPLYIRGTFSAPKVAPDVGKLGAKGLGALVMGAINPLLAVLPLIQEGKDKDSPCQQLIAEAAKSQKTGKSVAAKKPSSSAGRSAPSNGK
jgi:AsmA protein